MADVNQRGGGATFAAQARRKRAGLLSELWGFLKYHRKWWLLPILLALFAIAGLVWLGGSAAGPFVYTFF